jgi:small subunit ribosomal protein S4e
MGNKGGLRHLKRLPAPSYWPIHRKETAWAPKPNAGAHPTQSCLPLGVLLRDALGVAKTRREVVRILSQGKVKVDGRTRYTENYAVGLMDVVELAEANAYRILPVEKQGLTIIRIPKDEAKFKLCKVMDKKITRKGVLQFGVHDGRNFMIPQDATGEAKYATNDTLRVSVPMQRILNHIRFEKGNLALVVGGRNAGKSGKIVDLQNGTATRPAMVTIEDQTGNKFDTIVDYTFVVGTDKPAIKLEAA